VRRTDGIGHHGFHHRKSARTLRYDRALNLQSVPDFVALLDRYKIQTTLLAPGTPAIGLLDSLPGWKRVYSDVAVVHRCVTPIGVAPQH
jgi:hypothetical protein